VYFRSCQALQTLTFSLSPKSEEAVADAIFPRDCFQKQEKNTYSFD